MLLMIAPVFVTVVSVMFFKEKMTIKKIVAIVMSLVGCGFVVGIISGLKFDVFGIAMGLLGALFYAVYSICTKIAMRSDMTSDAHITYSFCFSALGSLFFANPLHVGAQIIEAPVRLPLVIGMGIVTAAFAGLMYTRGMRILPAGIASSMAVLEPIGSTVFSVLFLNEVLGPTSIVGFVLVISAVVMLGTEK